MVEVFDLKDKALRGEVAFAITGDAAAVCTGGNEAGQCLFGIKPIDKDAKHPLTSKPMLCQPIVDDDGCQRWEYMGAQSTDCCFVAGACMMKENETMASVPFQHYARTMLAIAKDGIPADGDEPAFPPQKYMTGTGDLPYQQKSSGDIGGGFPEDKAEAAKWYRKAAESSKLFEERLEQNAKDKSE